MIVITPLMEISDVMEKLIKVVNLEKSFFDGDSELKVLKGVNLEVNESEILAIMGASGAGKSTLLHLIGTLDRPTSGNIYYEDEDITTYSERELTNSEMPQSVLFFSFINYYQNLTHLKTC